MEQERRCLTLVMLRVMADGRRKLEKSKKEEELQRHHRKRKLEIKRKRKREEGHLV